LTFHLRVLPDEFGDLLPGQQLDREKACCLVFLIDGLYRQLRLAGDLARRQNGVVIDLGGKLFGLLDLGAYFFRLEGLPVFLELALRRILWRLPQRVKDVYAVLIFALLREALESLARPTPFQQLKA